MRKMKWLEKVELWQILKSALLIWNSYFRSLVFLKVKLKMNLTSQAQVQLLQKSEQIGLKTWTKLKTAYKL